jgi:hypothetical protein
VLRTKTAAGDLASDPIGSGRRHAGFKRDKEVAALRAACKVADISRENSVAYTHPAPGDASLPQHFNAVAIKEAGAVVEG